MNVETAETKPASVTVRSAPARPSAGALAVQAIAASAGVSLLCAIVGRATHVEALALIGGYGVVFLGIGAAPFQLRIGLDLYARLTGAVLVGFSVLLIAGGFMADIQGLWDPVVAAVLIGVPTILLHAIGVIRTETMRLTHPLSRGLAADEPSGGEEVQWADPSRRQLSLELTLAGTALWLVSALVTRDPHPGYWGMLGMITPAWYIGLVLVLIGFALGRRSELSAAAATFSFGLATVLTPALVYGAPREETAAKQMQITQYILLHHHIDVTAGIYQAFSSTFAGVGALSQLLGIHGMLGHMSLWSVATYWPVLLVFMRIAVLRMLTGRLLPTTGRRWTAVMLVLLVDSLGNDYFSPQSIGYVLSIGVLAFAINGLQPRPLDNRRTFWLLLLVGVALGPTHELSPYMAAGALLVLALFGQAPFWTCLPVGLPALAWAGLVHSAIGHNFSFSQLFSLSNFRPPVTLATKGLYRLSVVGTQSHILLLSLLMLIVLGSLGFFPNIRKKWAWAYALCPIVGLGFIAINPYGNEGIFRATLFAIPWMAVLAMKMPEPGRRLRSLRIPGVKTVALSTCLLALLCTFLIAAYSMDGTMVLSSRDVAVVDYLMRLPSRNAFVLSVGSADNPADGANFMLNYTALEWSQVANAPLLQQLHPSAVAATQLADRYGIVAAANGATSGSPLYLIWADSSLLYSNAYGLQAPSQMREWLKLLKTSPQWHLVDHAGGAYLFHLTAG